MAKQQQLDFYSFLAFPMLTSIALLWFYHAAKQPSSHAQFAIWAPEGGVA